MPAAKGSECRLYMGDGAPVEGFSAIGGLQVTGFLLEYDVPAGGGPAAGAWREAASDAGVAQVSISARGLFTDTAAEQALRGAGFNGTKANFRIAFGSGDQLEGPFRVTRYMRSGDVERLEAVEITLQSAGEIIYQPGS